MTAGADGCGERRCPSPPAGGSTKRRSTARGTRAAAARAATSHWPTPPPRTSASTTPPTSHWVTDDVNDRIATAAGSFQSELGYATDWDPTCLRTWLEDADGDGTYELTTTALAPGSYEWKAALDEGWAESYGAGGGPDNVPFTVVAGQRVTLRWDSATNVPTVEVTGGSGLEPGDAGLVTAPVRTGAADEVVYFVMTDRFADVAVFRE